MYKPKHDYRNSEMDALIAEWVHSDLDRAILRRKLLDRATYEKIAEEVERSPKCVKGRYKAAYTSLSRHFKGVSPWLDGHGAFFVPFLPQSVPFSGFFLLGVSCIIKAGGGKRVQSHGRYSGDPRSASRLSCPYVGDAAANDASAGGDDQGHGHGGCQGLYDGA